MGGEFNFAVFGSRSTALQPTDEIWHQTAALLAPVGNFPVTWLSVEEAANPEIGKGHPGQTESAPAQSCAQSAFAQLSSHSPWPWIAVAFLAAATHAHGIANPFVYDDWVNIVENPYMVDPEAIRKMFAGHVASFLGQLGVGNYYRPMMHLFHYCIYQLFGPRPEWFHLCCLALHVGVSLLVMAVVGRISGRRLVGWLAGLLFAVHPAHTEVVAWISCSPDLLSSLFSLLAIWLYLQSADAHGGRRVLLAVAMGSSLLVAELSKEIGVLVPVIIVAYELLVRRCRLAQLRFLWPEYTALAIATVGYLAARTYALGGFLPVPRQTTLAWTEHLWTCLALFYRYLVLIVWPLELNSLRYYWPDRSPLEPVVVAGGLSLVAFVALGIRLYRRRDREVLCLPIYLLPLLPMFLLTYLSNVLLMIERAAYLLSVGFCWLAAAGLVRLAERFGTRLAVLLVATLLVFYTGRSAVRMSDWSDEIGLFQEGVARAPDPFHPLFSQGQALLRQNRPVEAVASLCEALRLRPGYAETHDNLGQAYSLLRQPQLALRHFRRAGQLLVKEGRADFAARAHYNLGITYRTLARNREAIAAYRQAVRLDPEFAAARNNLAFALLLEGHVEEARGELGTAIAGDPTFWQAHANEGLAHAMSGQWHLALAALSEAERLSPDNSEVQARIGEIHLARGERFSSTHKMPGPGREWPSSRGHRSPINIGYHALGDLSLDARARATALSPAMPDRLPLTPQFFPVRLPTPE